jgi:hypothetical protein
MQPLVFSIDGRRFFNEDLKINIDDQIERVSHDYASALIVDGGVGKGKTHNDVQIADYISITKGQGVIDLDIQLARGYEEFFSKLDECIKAKRSVIVYDEAGDFSKKGTLTKINMLLSRVFEQYRQFHIIVILSLPLSDSLDNSLLHNEIPRMILHTDRRFDHWVEGRAYSLKRFFQIKHTMSKLAQKSLAYNSYPCNFHFRIYKLPEDRAKEVTSFSLVGKKKQIKTAIISSQNLLSYYDIANKVHKTPRWVMQKLKAGGFKHKKIFDRKKYFDENVIEYLEELD